MNRDLIYPNTGRAANQLKTLDAIGSFDNPLGTELTTLPALPDPGDSSVTLRRRARAYLHANCAQCHRAGGPTPASMDLHHATPDDEMNVCNARPERGDLGIAGTRLLVPGDPDKSLLLVRIKRRDAHGMPPLASGLVDTEGMCLIEAWIMSLRGCP